MVGDTLVSMCDFKEDKMVKNNDKVSKVESKEC